MAHEMEYVDVEVVMIPNDDGTEQECAILDEFELKGKDYMILSPSVDGVCGGNLQFYRVEEDGEDLLMDLVEDEAELDAVRDEFRKRLAK